jgi:tetratricopeptide (TPR) repeat protein
LAIFGKFGGSSSNETSPGDYSPEKAQKFFEHARTVFDTQNFEYAIQLYCNGLKQDPRVKAALDGLYTAVTKFKESPAGKKGVSKDTWRAIAGSGDVAKFVSTLLEYLLSERDLSLAMRAAELGGKIKCEDVGATIADIAMQLAANDKKPRKDYFLRLSEAYQQLSRHDKSLMAAEKALSLDPSDGELAAKIRSLAAAATMEKGRYEQFAGTEGGFRHMIKNAEKQQQLTDADSIVKTEETLDRVVALCEADYNSRPTDQHAIEKFASRLVERGHPADLRRAIEVLNKGYADTQQIRFRIRVGELELRADKAKLDDLERDLKKHPDDTMLRGVYETEKQHYVDRCAEEYKVRIAAYPTDNQHKFDLAKLYFNNGRPQDAIALLQAIQNDPKIRPTVLNMLALSFMKIEFLPEAVATFRQALESREVSGDFSMDVQYNLMHALRKLAETEGDLPSAEEANKIASQITRQKADYRDIITQRMEINKIVQSLKSK